MMIRAFFIFAVVLAALASTNKAAANTASSPTKTHRTCLPENSLYIPPGHPLAGDMTKAEFKSILAKIKVTHEHYFPALNGRLKIKSDWDDGTVNAFADRDYEDCIVEVYGGLARYPALTKDGFKLIVCHELGHHLGGAPSNEYLWPSIEGQADYFATLKCLKRLFADEDNSAAIQGQTIDASVRTTCEKQSRSSAELDICLRTALASLSASQMIYELDGRGKKPSFSTPDPRQVKKTDTNHPEAQCRLDTFVAGTYCQANLTENPGATDPALHTCIEGRDAVGFRPRCWYRP